MRSSSATRRPCTIAATRANAKRSPTSLRALTKFCRLTLTSPRDRAGMAVMADHFGLDVDPKDPEVVDDLIHQGDNLARDEGLIDYDDMVYLPAAWDLRPRSVGFVAVDEAQDLNAAQQQLVLKLAGKGGRILAVGDPSQSIYGFAAADAESFNTMRRLTTAVDLPLSICYRCPTSHIRLAQAIVPHIEAREGAPEGIIGDVKRGEMDKVIRPGDLILCRLTAPLVSACLGLIRSRIHARVRGRDIGASLGRIIRAVEGMPDYTWERFPEFLQKYINNQVENLVRLDASPARIDSLTDQMDSILVCYEVASVKSAGELSAYIEGLFDDNTPAVMLSTVHRAKGLENDRVFILAPDKLPLIWKGQREWELQQERNLRYVALTRSTSELYFVEE